MLFYHTSFSVFLVIDLYFVIPAAIAQIFDPISKLVISIEIPSKEAKPETEIHAATTEAKIRNFQYNLESYKPVFS